MAADVLTRFAGKRSTAKSLSERLLATERDFIVPDHPLAIPRHDTLFDANLNDVFWMDIVSQTGRLVASPEKEDTLPGYTWKLLHSDIPYSEAGYFGENRFHEDVSCKRGDLVAVMAGRSVKEFGYSDKVIKARGRIGVLCRDPMCHSAYIIDDGEAVDISIISRTDIARFIPKQSPGRTIRVGDKVVLERTEGYKVFRGVSGSFKDEQGYFQMPERESLLDAEWRGDFLEMSGYYHAGKEYIVGHIEDGVAFLPFFAQDERGYYTGYSGIPIENLTKKDIPKRDEKKEQRVKDRVLDIAAEFFIAKAKGRFSTTRQFLIRCERENIDPAGLLGQARIDEFDMCCKVLDYLQARGYMIGGREQACQQQ